MTDRSKGGRSDRGPRKTKPGAPGKRPAPAPTKAGERAPSRAGKPSSTRAGRRPPGAARRGEAAWEPGTSDRSGPERPRRATSAGPRSSGPATERNKKTGAPGGAEKPPARYSKRPGGRPFPRKPKAASSTPDGLVRLNRYLAQSGICSRREADDLIKAGVVMVNGKVVTEMGTKVMPGDKVHYGGQRLSMEKKRYVLLNKPKGFITTTDDPRDRRTVMVLVDDACTERIYPVGRLDRLTTGLLLLTNDGDLAKKLTHPSHGAEKIYHVTLDKNVTKAHMEQLISGVELEDGPAQADEVNYVQGAGKSEVGIQIHMGRNRVVRRMFEALGYQVTKLDRVIFAGLSKKDLPRGKWRHLTENEVLFLSKRK